MKKIAAFVFCTALAGAMLLPICSPVNNHSGNAVLTADGDGGAKPPIPGQQVGLVSIDNQA